jgi:hypothetical protein
MRRIAVWVGICAMLLGGAMTQAHAQISVAKDGDQIDIVLRDADINAVLAALFNTTKQQFRVEAGVVGRIGRLQTRGKFEEVLNAVLGSDFSYTKTPQGEGVYLYRIVGRPGAAPSTGGKTGAGDFATMAPPSPSAPVSAAGDAKPAAKTDAAEMDSFHSLSFETHGKETTGPDGKTTTSTASGESKIRLVRVSNIDLRVLCAALGFGEAIDLFGTNQGGYGGSMGGTGYNSGMSGMNGMNGMNNGMSGMNNGMNGMNNGMSGMNNGMNGMNNGMSGRNNGMTGMNGMGSGTGTVGRM